MHRNGQDVGGWVDIYSWPIWWWCKCSAHSQCHWVACLQHNYNC